MRAMPFAIIIVIGWLYVTVLVAANEPTIISGIISFLFYGALPCGIILYLSGSRIRRQRKRFREMMAERNKENDVD
jgi:TRAP-type C4-dicarboxylate transport system permease small subunit